MKNIFLISTFILGSSLITNAVAADAPTGCAAKINDIQQQLSYAQQHNNAPQIAGLQKALSETRANCTDSGLQQQRQQKVAEKQQKVQERQQDLAKAEAKGNADKIRKQQEKLQSAQAELQDAKAELTR